MARIAFILFLLVAIIATPLLLQKEEITRPSPEEVPTLVIITPHSTSIRKEFELAFRKWHQAHYGSDIYFDWRVPGGTSEIAKLVNSAFQQAETLNAQKPEQDQLPLAKIGIGHDVFFGGGAYEFDQQAQAGQLQKLDIFSAQPHLFSDTDAQVTIPQSFGGEAWYHPEQLWIGACLSSFGIVYNKDVLKRLEIPEPSSWEDLANPRYFGFLALADPTKSGSATKAFEMLLQQQMQRFPEDEEQGFAAGILLLKKIAANARYFTDSSSKIPLDVAKGNSAAGMSIDFYARTLVEKYPDRVGFVAPEAGSSIGSDPIAIFRGAPNEEIAQRFVHFVLSLEGQQLWNQRVGTENGPQFTALRRLPIRRDFYQTIEPNLRSDPEINPFTSSAFFTYNPELTGALFSDLRITIRLLCMDLHEELKAAWHSCALLPENHIAYQLFADSSPLNKAFLLEHIKPARKAEDPIELHQLERSLLQQLRQRYQEVEQLAPHSP